MSDFLLKKVGNLYILNIGANDGVKEYSVYNLYFEREKRLPLIRLKIKTERELFGTVQVTQLFPEYCVVRIISQVMDKEPQGNRIVLVPKKLPKKLMDQAQGLPFSRTPAPLSQAEMPETPAIVKDLDTPVPDEHYKPFSIGINYFREFDRIARPITDNLIADLAADVYNGAGVFSSSFSTNGGVDITLSKMLFPHLTVEGSLAHIRQKSSLASKRNPDSPPPSGPLFVKTWDFDITTAVTNWSFSIQASQFEKGAAYFTGKPLGKRYAPRIGIGVDYATVKVSMDHNILIGKFIQDEERSLAEEHSMGGYWGMHAVAGVDYYFQALKFFAELNYNTWFTDKFDADFPFRIGAAVLF